MPGKERWGNLQSPSDPSCPAVSLMKADTIFWEPHVKCCFLVARRVRLFAIPQTIVLRLLCPWTSPGKNTGLGSHSLLKGIFLTQGLNSCLLHCRQILYYLSHQGNPIKKEKTPQTTQNHGNSPIMLFSKHMRRYKQTFMIKIWPISRFWITITLK